MYGVEQPPARQGGLQAPQDRFRLVDLHGSSGPEGRGELPETPFSGSLPALH